jgi:hypothetical protein
MSDFRYKCNNCGHQFAGNDFTTNCPIDGCNSNNITREKGGFKLNKKILFLIGAVLLIILMIVIFSREDKTESEPKPPTKTVTLDVKEINHDWYFTINIKEGKENRDFNYNELESIINSNTGRAIEFNIENKKLLLCYSDTGATILKLKLKNDDPNIKIVDTTLQLSLFGKEPDADANCPVIFRSTDFTIQEVYCDMKFDFMDTAAPFDKNKIKISLNGKAGNYRSKLTWSKQDIMTDKYDIWIVYDNTDTVPWQSNNNPVKSCITEEEINEGNKQILSITDQVFKFGNAFGNNPNNKVARNQFRSWVMKLPSGAFYLNGEKMNTVDELIVKIRSDFNNNNIKYKLKKKPVLKNKTMIIEFVPI